MSILSLSFLASIGRIEIQVFEMSCIPPLTGDHGVKSKCQCIIIRLGFRAIFIIEIDVKLAI